jgi:adenosylhomocysteinase
MSCRRRAKLPFPAINVNDSVTKSKFDNLYGCKESLVDAIRRATDVMLAGKVACVAGFGDVGKGSAQSLRNGGARVLVTEVDPICALQAAMEGFEVVTMEEAAPRADIFVHRDRQRRRADRGSHACDEEHGDRVEHRPLRQRDRDRWPQQHEVDRDQAAGRRGRVPRRQEDHRAVQGPPGEPRQRDRPPVVRDVDVVHQPGAGADRTVDRAEKYKNDVYVLPKHLDEKVAALHLEKLGVKLTKLSQKQADYIGVPVEGRSSRITTAIDQRRGAPSSDGASHPLLRVQSCGAAG